MSMKYNGNYIVLAKNLRKRGTPQENHLWYDFLSTYPIRFQRQKVIGNHIIDFYCHKAKLAIEIDGSQHYTDEAKNDDARRTEMLENYGLKVIRFTNAQISNQFSSVCKLIDEIVNASLREGGGTAKP